MYSMDSERLYDVYMAAMGIYMVVLLIISLIMIVSLWFIFRKAGRPGWASIVPFYNNYVLYDITWGQVWMSLLLLIPVANSVIQIITSVKLCNAFGKGGGFIVGMIFLPVVFYPILAFDSSAYIGVDGASVSE